MEGLSLMSVKQLTLQLQTRCCVAANDAMGYNRQSRARVASEDAVKRARSPMKRSISGSGSRS
jgi:hypothetical protein